MPTSRSSSVRTYSANRTASVRANSALFRLFPDERTGTYDLSSLTTIRSTQIASGTIGLDGAYGIEMLFPCVGSENGTVSYRLYGVDGVEDPDATDARDTQFVYRRIGSGTLTLGTTTGTGSAGVVQSTERFADGITYTPTNLGTAIENMTSASWIVNNDASNDVATLAVSDIGPFDGLFIDFDVDNATNVTSANVLVKLTS